MEQPMHAWFRKVTAERVITPEQITELNRSRMLGMLLYLNRSGRTIEQAVAGRQTSQFVHASTDSTITFLFPAESLNTNGHQMELPEFQFLVEYTAADVKGEKREASEQAGSPSPKHARVEVTPPPILSERKATREEHDRLRDEIANLRTELAEVRSLLRDEIAQQTATTGTTLETVPSQPVPTINASAPTATPKPTNLYKSSTVSTVACTFAAFAGLALLL
ncbi:hypothetical protein BJ741DRAFT_618737 [Chytriomyces cf. hyalinus JEL632]|nr:hypothetical protein BJ741DRAFT_618737 [Chytriomyces cf. hyalinus JEL632]